jgi:acyl-CoA-dependent ceramide synthase
LAALQALNISWLFCLLRSAYRFVVHSIAKDDRSEAEESELEEMERKKEETVKMFTKKVEALPLLNGNGFANGSANGVIKATGNRTAVPPTRGKALCRRSFSLSLLRPMLGNAAGTSDDLVYVRFSIRYLQST